jgi:hypothetical protein
MTTFLPISDAEFGRIVGASARTVTDTEDLNLFINWDKVFSE